jgi:glycosyltransferase involved in cell wall biosynthesis
MNACTPSVGRKADAPLISVLLPVHNAVRFLPDALASLAAQTCRDFEVVAVNDGSSDESAAMLEKFAEANPWVRVYHQEKAGISPLGRAGAN